MKKRRLNVIIASKEVRDGDIGFKPDYSGADYTSTCTNRLNDRTLINVTACVESVILFVSREG